MRTLRNNSGFLVNIPSAFSQILEADFNRIPSAHNKAATNIYENETEFGVEINVPGFQKKDFSIKVENEILHISAEIAEDENIETKKFSLREFSKSSFSRKFKLPADKVKEDEIAAQYENGILLLRLPKHELAKAKETKLVSVM